MQSKLHSVIEAASNTLIGYAINLVVQIIVYPFYGATFTLMQNMQIGLIFLVVSLLRGYVIRRYFNKKVKHE
jgi:hypothetical protein